MVSFVMMNVKTILALSVFLFLTKPSAPLHAAAESFIDSVYSSQGIEIRADVRVFTTMTLMTAMGWRTSNRHSEPPTLRPIYYYLRQKLIEIIPKVREPLNSQIEEFFITHPQPIERYLQSSLAYDPLEVESEQHPFVWSQWVQLQQRYMTQYHIIELATHFHQDYRQEMLMLLPSIDSWSKQLLQYLKLSAESALGLPTAETQKVIVIPNPLGLYGSSMRMEALGYSYILIGPSDVPSPEDVMSAYLSKMILAPILSQRLTYLMSYTKAWQHFHAKKPYQIGSEAACDYVAENLARAIIIHCFIAPSVQSEYIKNYTNQGYTLVKDFHGKLKKFAESDKSIIEFIDLWWPVKNKKKH